MTLSINFILVYFIYFLPLEILQTNKTEKIAECGDLRNFGDTKICFPLIKDYLESSLNPKLKERADYEIKSLGSDNKLLGFYLPTNELQVFNQNQSNGYLSELVKIYSVNQLMNKNVPSDFLQAIEQKLRNESEVVPWNDLNKKILSYNSNLSFSKPVLIEISQINPQSKSAVYFSSYSVSEKSQKILWIVNFCTIKRRLIYVSYSMNYKNAESLNELKVKNKVFLESFLKANQ